MLLCTFCAQAQDVLLPQILPRDLKNQSTFEALQKWIDLPTENTNNLFITQTTIRGKPWLLVYFEIYISIDTNDLEDASKVIKTLRSSMYALNQAGSEIRVLFMPYAKISAPQIRYQETFGKKLFKDSFHIKPVLVNVLKPRDPFWIEKNMTCSNGDGRSFARIAESKAFISQSSLRSLTHELNHVILLNQDAYFKPNCALSYDDTESLSCLNAKHCKPGLIHPIEIYIGLQRRGHLAPGWNEYVHRSFVLGPVHNHQLKIFHRSPPEISSSLFSFEIYNLQGEKVISQKYVVGNMPKYSDHMRVDRIPDDINISHLKPGAYLYQININDDLHFPNLMILDRPYKVASSIRFTSKFLVE